MIVLSDIQRCQHPHFTKLFQKGKNPVEPARAPDVRSPGERALLLGGGVASRLADPPGTLNCELCRWILVTTNHLSIGSSHLLHLFWLKAHEEFCGQAGGGERGSRSRNSDRRCRAVLMTSPRTAPSSSRRASSSRMRRTSFPSIERKIRSTI